MYIYFLIYPNFKILICTYRMELKRKSFCIADNPSLSEHGKRSKLEDLDEEFQPNSFIEATVSNDVKLITKELYSLKKVVFV
jgi:hypothetical protein